MYTLNLRPFCEGVYNRLCISDFGTTNRTLSLKGFLLKGLIMRKITTEVFIQKAKKKHGDKFDYSLVNYINQRTTVKIICPIHGLFEQLPDVHTKSKSGCPKCIN